jgi:succinate dehydrogenase / fumarate reductase flavoprotein subunit
MRDDEHFSYVAAWEWSGDTDPMEPVTSGAIPKPVLHKEPLKFDYVHLSQRSYK